ncbi:MAG: beta-glucuronidase [Chitinivibrionales bacterium]|nr:beta-glucuronidase [Chitinivibrionales bacterium]
MLRLFREHEIRRCVPLDGRWEFVTAAQRRDRRKLPSRYVSSMQVPGVWESLPGLENYRGTAWLRTEVETHEDLALRLVFGGVSHTGTAFIDGRKVGSHYDAFTPWDCVVPRLGYGRRELVVEVDNSFGGHSALHRENDYYTYGGITRPVEAQYVPAVYIERMLATPQRRGKKWELDVRVVLRNWSQSTAERAIAIEIAGLDHQESLGGVIVPGNGTREVRRTLKGLSPEMWDSQSPKLYSISVLLLDDGCPVDDLIDRIGFREVEVQGSRILLNGQQLRLRGFNRHEDHPQFGCALPVAAMADDLEIMRDLGANFVRTSHYPNDMRFLDLCDELGMYVWEESHARAVPFDQPAYREQITASTTEMVHWHHNRPSIIMWGCLNECESNTRAGCREHERVLKLLKRLDPSRPTTFASNKHRNDLCLGHVDIVAWNRYDAWYGGSPADVKPALEEALAWLDSAASKGGAGKPVIMSEFGAGALSGNRQRCRAPWSEEYQCDALDESLRVYLGHPRLSGSLVWQFCDVRVTRGWWGRRPRTMNNKGVVDEYRRPKLAYDIVRKRMRKGS